MPVDIMYGEALLSPVPQCPIEYVEWVREASQEAYGLLRQQVQIAATRQKRLYDQGKGTPHFYVGAWVWRNIPPREKLACEWHGPYLILKKLGDLNYEIQREQGGRKVVVHVDQLKKFQGEVVPKSWVVEVEIRDMDGEAFMVEENSVEEALIGGEIDHSKEGEIVEKEVCRAWL